MWVGDEILYRALHISHTHLCLADRKVWSVVVLVSSIKLVTMRVIPLRELVLSKTEAAQAVPAESLLRAKGLGMRRAWRKNCHCRFNYSHLLVNDRLALLVRHGLDVAVEEDVRAPVEYALGSTLHKNCPRTVVNLVNVNLVLVLRVEGDDEDGRVRFADLLDISFFRSIISLRLGQLDESGLGRIPDWDPVHDLELAPVSLDGDTLEGNRGGVPLRVEDLLTLVVANPLGGLVEG